MTSMHLGNNSVTAATSFLFGRLVTQWGGVGYFRLKVMGDANRVINLHTKKIPLTCWRRNLCACRCHVSSNEDKRDQATTTASKREFKKRLLKQRNRKCVV